jgi:hypothetical protein
MLLLKLKKQRPMGVVSVHRLCLSSWPPQPGICATLVAVALAIKSVYTTVLPDRDSRFQEISLLTSLLVRKIFPLKSSMEVPDMAKVKVLYFDQTAGEVEDSFLNDLIAKRQIAAFCGSSGWVDVLYDKISDVTAEQKVVEG